MSMSGRAILDKLGSMSGPPLPRTAPFLASVSLFAKSAGAGTGSMILDSVAGYLDNAIVRLVASQAVIDFEKDMARNQVGAVFGNPGSGQVELRPQFFGHGIVEQVGRFDGEVLQDGA